MQINENAYIALFFVSAWLPLVFGLILPRLPAALLLGAAAGILDAFIFRLLFGKTFGQQNAELTMTPSEIVFSDILRGAIGAAWGLALTGFAFLAIREPMRRLRARVREAGMSTVNAEEEDSPSDQSATRP